MPRYLTAEEAADELDIAKNTLYAYVSRGLLRSEPADEGHRARRYRADDVQRLKRRTQQRTDPEAAARTALDWGLPVAESALTLIKDGLFYYRGHDACHLAKTHSLEDVASLLWDTDDRIDINSTSLPAYERPSSDPESTLGQMQALLPQMEDTDDHAYDRSKAGIVRTGSRLMDLLTTLVESNHGTERPGPVAERLGIAWKVKETALPLLNAALVLSADHGLNVTAFAVRCVASSGTTPYGAVSAGLSTVRGRRHTGNTARIAALLQEAGSPEQFRATVRARLRRGDTVPGFGHRLYPDGDPRAQMILEMLQATRPMSTGTAFAEAAQTVGPDLLDRPPAFDFALVALERTLDLPSGAALTLFALGRMVGWTGHMIEQYEEGQVIRPRAQYVGPPPKTGAA
ncbi:hypothetical protein BSZ35_10915 [Salinibacter sp. 10B]|uniref:citrate synthase family protein n=1 Tax=Salinibacter sp. 10B TaxID=1923971 RepID=UPI000CF4AB76|nr:citrate synthase family protein [Salinibacter sp. 10B]PQJ35036.1 hypothetical protein BSZ35_10915 [Salinibacter sp. 10B]